MQILYEVLGAKGMSSALALQYMLSALTSSGCNYRPSPNPSM